MAKHPKPLNIQPRRDGDGWEVRRQGAERASGTFDTKAAAVERGREQAKAEGGSVKIKKENGQIQEERTYHTDPYPPAG
jgi:hypothetical protein